MPSHRHAATSGRQNGADTHSSYRAIFVLPGDASLSLFEDRLSAYVKATLSSCKTQYHEKKQFVTAMMVRNNEQMRRKSYGKEVATREGVITFADYQNMIDAFRKIAYRSYTDQVLGPIYPSLSVDLELCKNLPQLTIVYEHTVPESRIPVEHALASMFSQFGIVFSIEYWEDRSINIRFSHAKALDAVEKIGLDGFWKSEYGAKPECFGYEYSPPGAPILGENDDDIVKPASSAIVPPADPRTQHVNTVGNKSNSTARPFIPKGPCFPPVITTTIGSRPANASSSSPKVPSSTEMPAAPPSERHYNSNNVSVPVPASNVPRDPRLSHPPVVISMPVPPKHPDSSRLPIFNFTEQQHNAVRSIMSPTEPEKDPYNRYTPTPQQTNPIVLPTTTSSKVFTPPHIQFAVQSEQRSAFSNVAATMPRDPRMSHQNLSESKPSILSPSLSSSPSTLSMPRPPISASFLPKPNNLATRPEPHLSSDSIINMRKDPRTSNTATTDVRPISTSASVSERVNSDQTHIATHIKQQQRHQQSQQPQHNNSRSNNSGSKPAITLPSSFKLLTRSLADTSIQSNHQHQAGSSNAALTSRDVQTSSVSTPELKLISTLSAPITSSDKRVPTPPSRSLSLEVKKNRQEPVIQSTTSMSSEMALARPTKRIQDDEEISTKIMIGSTPKRLQLQLSGRIPIASPVRIDDQSDDDVETVGDGNKGSSNGNQSEPEIEFMVEDESDDDKVNAMKQDVTEVTADARQRPRRKYIRANAPALLDIPPAVLGVILRYSSNTIRSRDNWLDTCSILYDSVHTWLLTSRPTVLDWGLVTSTKTSKGGQKQKLYVGYEDGVIDLFEVDLYGMGHPANYTSMLDTMINGVSKGERFTLMLHITSPHAHVRHLMSIADKTPYALVTYGETKVYGQQHHCIHLWDTNHWPAKELRTRTSTSFTAIDVCSRFLVAAGADRHIHLWYFDKLSEAKVLETTSIDIQRPIISVSVCIPVLNTPRVIIGTPWALLAWDYKNDEAQLAMACVAPINSVAVHDKSKTVAIIYERGKCTLAGFDAQELTIESTLVITDGSLQRTSLCPDSPHIAMSLHKTLAGEIRLWNVKDGSPLFTHYGSEHGIVDARWNNSRLSPRTVAAIGQYAENKWELTVWRPSAWAIKDEEPMRETAHDARGVHSLSR